jgi:putative glutamine transport system substrate-binding protein
MWMTRRGMLAAALAIGLGAALLPGHVRAAAPATLDQIKARGTLKIGVKYDAPPFGSLNPRTNQVEGLEIDLARAIAGKVLGDPKKVDFVQVTSQNRIPLLQNGDIDMFVATATITPQRLQEIAFSDVYYRSGQSLLVKKGSPVKSYRDLAGRSVCTVTGSTPEQTIRRLVPKANVQTFETYPDCFQALLGGRVDAMTTDDGILLGFQHQAPEQTQIVGGTFTFEPYGIGIAKGNATLLSAVNAALRQIGKDGTYAKLYKSDLGRPLPPDFKSWYALSAQTAAQRFVAENAAK